MASVNEFDPTTGLLEYIYLTKYQLKQRVRIWMSRFGERFPEILAAPFGALSRDRLSFEKSEYTLDVGLNAREEKGLLFLRYSGKTEYSCFSRDYRKKARTHRDRSTTPVSVPSDPQEAAGLGGAGRLETETPRRRG